MKFISEADLAIIHHILSVSLISDIKKLVGSYREELQKVLVWATIQVMSMRFSSGRQMNLTANPSRTPEENKAYLQKCISQLALYWKGDLREKFTYCLICCFPTGSGLIYKTPCPGLI